MGLSLTSNRDHIIFHSCMDGGELCSWCDLLPRHCEKVLVRTREFLDGRAFTFGANALPSRMQSLLW